MAHKVFAYALPVAVGWVAAVGLLAMARNSHASMKAVAASYASAPGAQGGVQAPAPGDNTDLWTMLSDSEKEHSQNNLKLKLTPEEILKRDSLRIERVRKMYQAGLIVTAADCYNAAVLLQRGHTSEDFILAHDLAVLAVSMGLKRATWLTAETEDKFLISVGKPQRFATQYEPVIGHMPKLYSVDPDVTDSHRLSVGAVTLSEARRRTTSPEFAD